MTYNPYADEPTKAEVDEMTGRLNAPKDVSDRLKGPMRVLLRHDPKAAEKMVGAFKDLIDAYEERGADRTWRQTMIVEDAVARTVELAKERCLPPSRVADEIIPSVNGTQGERLKRQGLIYLANNALHSGRNGGGVGRAESEVETAEPASGRDPQPGYPHPADGAGWDPLTEITLQTADGERIAPLLKLGIEDLSAAAHRFAGQIEGLKRKRDFLYEAANACENHGAEKIAELPEGERERLARKAREAWS